MRTLFIVVSHGLEARDLLRTGLAERLAGTPDLRVVIISPASDNAGFRKGLEAPNLIHEHLPRREVSSEPYFVLVRKYLFLTPEYNSTANTKQEELKDKARRLYPVVRAVNAVTGRWDGARRAWIRLESLLFGGREFDDLFRKYGPSLVVVPTPGAWNVDAHVMRAAKRFGVRTLCVSFSWDHVTSKGWMGAVPDRYAVWGPQDRDDLSLLHGYDPQRVDITGSLKHDVFAQRESLLDESEVYARLGLEPGIPIVLYGTINPRTYAHNQDVLRVLKEIQARRPAPPRFHIVARVHPQALGRGELGQYYRDDVETYRVMEDDGCRLDIPKGRDSGLDWDVDSSDLVWLPSLIAACSVVVVPQSSLTLDACALDKPVVNIGFDGIGRDVPYAQSVRRLHDYTHYRRVHECGAARVAWSPQQLEEELMAYLEDPARDAEGRRAVIERICYRIDGRAADRTAALIHRLASEHDHAERAS